jgi:hypothetical protein
VALSALIRGLEIDSHKRELYVVLQVATEKLSDGEGKGLTMVMLGFSKLPIVLI